MEWTLSGELLKRGMDLQKACILCDMDKPTMEILLRGGRTLPQFAVKIGKALRLEEEQIARLGQPLNKEIWLAHNSGLPRPNGINFDQEFYKLGKRSAKRICDRRVWLDCESICRYLWENRLPVEDWMHVNGSKHQRTVNIVQNDRVRLKHIIRLEKMYNLPPNVAETPKCMADIHVSSRFLVRREVLNKAMKPYGDNLTPLVNKYCSIIRPGSVRKHVAERIKETIRQAEVGSHVTLAQLMMMGSLLELSIYDMAEPIVQTRERRTNHNVRKGVKQCE